MEIKQISLLAIGLLLASAIIHAAWNLLLKQTGEKHIAMWWAVIIGGICFLPLLAFSPLFSLEVLPLAIFSGIFQAAYVIALAACYKKGDFSVIYPLSRGAAPIFLITFSFLFLGETINLTGAAGILILLSGLIIISGGYNLLKKDTAARANLPGILLAILTAFFVAVFSTIDGSAMRKTNPLTYMVIVFWLMLLTVTPVMLKYYRWEEMKAGLRADWLKISAVGVLSVVAYGIALAAFSIAPIGYSGAIRESSIVFGTFAGWAFLNENFNGTRIAGAIAVFAGIIVIAFA